MIEVSTNSSSQSRWENEGIEYSAPYLRLRQVATLVTDLHPQSLLDLGCAQGHLRELCPGIAYTGVDFVPLAHPGAFPFWLCDFNRETLPPSLRNIELIVCSGILEYVNDVPGFLRQVHSRLCPNGHLIATYYNMNHIYRVAQLLQGKSFPVHPDWRNFYAPADIAAQLDAAGLKVVRKIATNHSVRRPPRLEQTTASSLSLPRARPWSTLFAHQFLFVAKKPD
jgi:2-polyprenyl-3-methyl-5-hydroxy-6-metoxy-1,4-benzoquinol methylase